MKCFVAVDGGGSKSEVVLVDVLGHIFYHDLLDSSNPNNSGVDKAIKVLEEAINNSKEIADKNGLELTLIYLALAGVNFGDSKEEIFKRISNDYNGIKVVVVNDLDSVKEVGLKDYKDGVVVISGTGFNSAYKIDNKFTSLGGWGYLADDYISGFDLGRDLLKLVTFDLDNNEDTLLLKEFKRKYNDEPFPHVLGDIYKKGVKEVASLAKIVLDNYYIDSRCKGIIDTRVSNLAKQIKAKMRDKKDIRVVLFGGIFQSNKFVSVLLQEELGNNYSITISKEKTIFGTVSLAKGEIAKDIKEGFDKEFLKSYEGV